MSTFKVQIAGPGGTVIFQASSPLSESRNANYDGYNITHLPTDLWAYRNTTGRKFQITGKLVSRTPDEADENAFYLDLIRQWILPDFGETGATPPILKLKAYNNNNINNVSTILNSYSFQFPDDVDYIWQDDCIPMPVLATLQVDLTEAYTAEEITAKAWKIDLSEGSGFENGGSAGDSSSLTLNFQTKQNGIASNKSKIPGLGSFLGSAVGSAVVNRTQRLVQNSSVIRDVTRGVAAIQNNPFLRGIGNRLINQSSQAVTQLATSLTTTVSNSFGRTNNLPPPPIIGG